VKIETAGRKKLVEIGLLALYPTLAGSDTFGGSLLPVFLGMNAQVVP
jgi:hypothetical protein